MTDKAKGRTLRITPEGLVDCDGAGVKCAICSKLFDVNGSVVQEMSTLVDVLVAPTLCDSCIKCPTCGKPADFSVLLQRDPDDGKLHGRRVSAGCAQCNRFYGGNPESWFAYIALLMERHVADERRAALAERPCNGVDPKPSCFGCYAKPACDILATVDNPEPRPTADNSKAN